MKIIYTVNELREEIKSSKGARERTGLIPTMGALHKGHISLVDCCRKRDELVVASIFVNPTQFNDASDLKNYPRTPEKDFEMLENAGCDIVFYPDEKEVYPEPDGRIFDFGGLDKLMEGKHRPGHFNGVAQIVTRLFEMVQPDSAYFGIKDLQQLAIIRRIVKDQELDIEIVGCDIVREPDGLAMSSRNMLLTEEERSLAVIIPQTLFMARKMAATNSLGEIKSFVINKFNDCPEVQVDYFEIVDAENLLPIKGTEINKNSVACIAVKLGRVRLIDNMFFY